MTSNKRWHADVQDATGCTYRELDYWTRRGYLRPNKERAGSGYSRTWPEPEVQIAALMRRLIDAGLIVAIAAEAARLAIECCETEICIWPGIWLRMEDLVFDQAVAQ